MTRIKNVLPQVDQILAYAPETRDSDKKLLLAYYAHMGLHLDPAQRAKFMELPSPDTITRARRKIQESGRFQPAKEIKDERAMREGEVRQEMLWT